MDTDFNDWADFWFYEMGINVLSADTVNKVPTEEWSEYQNKPMPPELFEKRKRDGLYKNGIALIPGEVWRGPNKGKYLGFIDLDNQKAIDEVCGCFGAKDLEELSQSIIVERHKGDLSKAHLYFYSGHEFRKKSSDVAKLGDKIKDNEIPAIEVKGLGKHGISFCSPSLHNDGTRYEIIGTKEPKTCGKEVEDNLFKIYEKYKLNVDTNNQIIPIEKLFEKDFVIFEGHNRPEGLLRAMESLISRNKKILSEEQIKKFAGEWNQEHCRPPLDDKKFEKQWVCAKKFISKHNKGNNDDEEKKDDKNNNESDVSRLLSSVEQRCEEIFLDQLNDIYVCVKVNGHTEVLPIESKRFEGIILHEHFENEKTVLSKERMANILNLIKARAELKPDIRIRELSLRVAKGRGNGDGDDFCYLYDLTNPNWEVIKITSEHWEITSADAPIFKRYRNSLPQVIPNKNYSETIVERFLNLFNLESHQDKLLLLVYLVCLFIPDISKPILIIRGSKGSAKTTAFEMIKRIVDPSNIDTLFFPKDTNDLIQTLSHNYLSNFDNISSISDSLSDLLCRVVTGTGISKRRLYTDDDDVVYKFKRAIGVNGINLASVRPDFLDRALVIEVKRIPKDKRRRDEDIKREFRQLLPDILGWVFDVLVKTLRYRTECPEKIKLKEYPRMADFAESAEIVSRCIGYAENRFVDAYFENIDIQNEEIIESSTVAKILLKFLEDRDGWSGTASELYEVLSSIANDSGLSRSKSWPIAPNSLSRKLNELSATLKEKGVEILRLYDNKNHGRVIKIIKSRNISLISSYCSSDGNIENEQSGNPEWSNNILNKGEKINDNTKTNVDLPIHHGNNQHTNIDKETIHHSTIKTEPNTIGSIENNQSNTSGQDIHNIANRLYPGSDTWLCKNCNERGDRWHILNHTPHCKMNKKQ